MCIDDDTDRSIFAYGLNVIFTLVSFIYIFIERSMYLFNSFHSSNTLQHFRDQISIESEERMKIQKRLNCIYVSPFYRYISLMCYVSIVSRK